MTDWLTTNKRKIRQRALNKIMRQLNKSIENDFLWRGRFIVRQIGGQWKNYEDTSDYYYWVQLILIDKKTGKFKTLCDDSNHWCWRAHLFWEMNTFIVNDCKVWENEGREELYEKDKTDYRRYKVNIIGTWNPKVEIIK